MADEPEFDLFNRDRESLGNLPHPAMFRAYQRVWHNATLEQQNNAIRGIEAGTNGLPASEKTPSITNLCNMIQRGAIDLDALVDEVTDDGVVDADERVRVRAFIKQLFDKLCNLAAHVAEPVPA